MGNSGTLLPLALAALSGCVLPRCLALQKIGADLGVTFERAATTFKTRLSPGPPQATYLSWWTEGSRYEWLTLHDIQVGRDATAIVTHAGKNNQAYIDHAVILGVSLKRHVPDYVRIALGVKGMTDANQAILRDAGWHVVLVSDYRFPQSYHSYHGCNASCGDDTFMTQHQDSMERINIFRLPIGRVLYLDADTYVASGELNSLLNGTDKNLVPAGNIGMVHNPCKRTYSAGVMLFEPSLEMYRGMLVKVAEIMAGNASRKSDEQIINEAYEKQATALDRKYNCMDPWDVQGADKCQRRCTEVVVSHFFGNPKPAIADETFLSFVRKPTGPFEKCSEMNHGSCSSWSNFYCDLADNVEMLTRPLQHIVKHLGGCCHTPALASDPDDCHSVQEDCPETVSVDFNYKLSRRVNKSKPAPWFGNYNKTATVVLGQRTITPDPFFYGGRPIYTGPDGYYLFYALQTKNWIVGRNIMAAQAKSDAELIGNWMPHSYAHDYHRHTKCPEHTTVWTVPRAHHYHLDLLQNESAMAVTDPNAAKGQSLELLTKYLMEKYLEYKKLSLKHKRGTAKYLSYKALAKKHKAKYLMYKQISKNHMRKTIERRQARHHAKVEGNAATGDEMTPQDKVTKDDTISEDNAFAVETVPEDKTTADETGTEDISTAGAMPKELEETEDTEYKLDGETPLATAADEAATEDTINTGEAPTELEEVSGPTETEHDAETPEIPTADETGVEDITTAGEMPKELEETADTETKLDAETPQVTAADEAATEDTINTGEAPKELDAVKDPTEAEHHAETPDISTADETGAEDIATAGEMPKELEATEDRETKLDAETPEVTTADKAATEDNTNTSEAPKELQDVKGPEPGFLSRLKLFVSRLHW